MYVASQSWIENGPRSTGVGSLGRRLSLVDLRQAASRGVGVLPRAEVRPLMVRRGRGMGVTQLIPASPGVSPATAQAACTAAGGTWAGGALTASDGTAAGGCSLDLGASFPSWCSWVPFASSLSSECQLPSTPAQLNAYGSYTAFQIGQQSGLQAEQSVLDQNAAQSSALLQDPSGTGDPEANCEYNAAANNPALSQVVGPLLTCAITDPANSSYSFLIYGGLALLAVLFLMGGKK
jgi:hypothetical protein